MKLSAKELFRKQFRWKIVLLRIPVNGLALIITGVLVPNIYFVNKSLASLVLMAVMLGVFNAIVKPIVQFLTLPFLFASYGLIVVFINGFMLALLSRAFPSYFHVQGVLWALLGGAVIGLVSSVLENLFGVTPPITSDEARLATRPKSPPRAMAVLSDALSGPSAAGIDTQPLAPTPIEMPAANPTDAGPATATPPTRLPG